MNRPIDWDSITVPLDVQAIDAPAIVLRRWPAYERTERGWLFQCETADGQEAKFRVDVIEPDVIRARMALGLIQEGTSDILVRDERDDEATAFEIEETDDSLILSTERLQLEFVRYPWQTRASSWRLQHATASPEKMW